MAIIKKTELKQMDRNTAKTKIIDLRRQLIKINAQISAGTLPENPGRVKEIRRTIARLMTKISQLNQQIGGKNLQEVKSKA